MYILVKLLLISQPTVVAQPNSCFKLVGRVMGWVGIV